MKKRQNQGQENTEYSNALHTAKEAVKSALLIKEAQKSEQFDQKDYIARRALKEILRRLTVLEENEQYPR